MDIPQVKSHADAETGAMGQEYLATGKRVDLRRWEEAAGDWSDPSCRDYETEKGSGTNSQMARRVLRTIGT